MALSLAVNASDVRVAGVSNYTASHRLRLLQSGITVRLEVSVSQPSMAAAQALATVLSAVLAPGNAQFLSTLASADPALAVLRSQGGSVTVAVMTSGVRQQVVNTEPASPPLQNTPQEAFTPPYSMVNTEPAPYPSQNTPQAAFAPPSSTARLAGGGGQVASLLDDSASLFLGLAIGGAGLCLITVGSALFLRSRRRAQAVVEACEERSNLLRGDALLQEVRPHLLLSRAGAVPPTPLFEDSAGTPRYRGRETPGSLGTTPSAASSLSARSLNNRNPFQFSDAAKAKLSDGEDAPGPTPRSARGIAPESFR